MKAKTYNRNGEEIGEVELPAIFDIPLNMDLIHQVFRIERANKRKVLAHTKGRGEVSGGGKKPWRQKGTGRARHGSIRSPLWKGGGVTHGPIKARNFSLKLNKKMRRKALAMVIAEKIRREKLILLNSIDIESGRTRDAAKLIHKFCGPPSKRKSALVLLARPDKNTARAYRNLDKAKVMEARSVSVSDLLEKQYVLMPQDAIPVLESILKAY